MTEGVEAVKNIILTDRDMQVMESLYRNCVMTYSQIAARHFPSTSKPTVINRLTKLEKAGFIRRERIPRMVLGRDKNAIGVVFQITRSGIAKLRLGRRYDIERPLPVKLHPYTLHHDLVLVDVARALDVRFGAGSVTNGKVLSPNVLASSGLEPDLVVKMPGEDGLVAIELELTAKSEKRYREIVLRYRLSKDFAKVIYLVDDPYIQRIMTQVITNRPVQAKAETGKFFFCALSDFLNHPMSASISNGVECFGRKEEV